ncbi:MAG: metallophosphoesterase [Myxococcales bacterium]|nr:metallophosphoesterase [Myxococcales bacterium]
MSKPRQSFVARTSRRAAFVLTLGLVIGWAWGQSSGGLPPKTQHAHLTALSTSPLHAALAPGSSLVAVLPDTQIYALKHPELFRAQTAFLAENAFRLDIRYAIHLGDIVHENTETEWRVAEAALQRLHGVVPLAIVPGNHDYGEGGLANTRDTPLNQHLSFTRAAAMPTFAEAFEGGHLENTAHLFSIGRHAFVLLALEWGPRDEVLSWANQVMRRYPERLGILATHAYLDHDDRRQDQSDPHRDQRHNPHSYPTPGRVNDGEEIWQKLVRHHRFVLTLSGHVLGDGTGHLVSRTDVGTECHQILANYQTQSRGGDAFMRLLEFLQDSRTVRVLAYSPARDQLISSPDQSFVFTLP